MATFDKKTATKTDTTTVEIRPMRINSNRSVSTEASIESYRPFLKSGGISTKSSSPRQIQASSADVESTRTGLKLRSNFSSVAVQESMSSSKTKLKMRQEGEKPVLRRVRRETSPERTRSDAFASNLKNIGSGLEFDRIFERLEKEMRQINAQIQQAEIERNDSKLFISMQAKRERENIQRELQKMAELQEVELRKVDDDIRSASQELQQENQARQFVMQKLRNSEVENQEGYLYVVNAFTQELQAIEERRSRLQDIIHTGYEKRYWLQNNFEKQLSDAYVAHSRREHEKTLKAIDDKMETITNPQELEVWARFRDYAKQSTNVTSAELNRAYRTIARMVEDIEVQKATVNELQDQLRSYKNIEVPDMNRLQELRDENATLRSQMLSQQQQLQNAESAKNQYAQQLNRLSQENQEKSQKIQELTAALRTKNSTVAELTDEQKNKIQAAEQLSKIFTAANAALRSRGTTSAGAVVNNLKNILKTYESTPGLSSVTKFIKDAIDMIEKDEKAIANYKKAEEDLNAEIADLEQQIKKQTNEAVAIEKQIDVLAQAQALDNEQRKKLVKDLGFEAFTPTELADLKKKYQENATKVKANDNLAIELRKRLIDKLDDKATVEQLLNQYKKELNGARDVEFERTEAEIYKSLSTAINEAASVAIVVDKNDKQADFINKVKNALNRKASEKVTSVAAEHSTQIKKLNDELTAWKSAAQNRTGKTFASAAEYSAYISQDKQLLDQQEAIKNKEAKENAQFTQAVVDVLKQNGLLDEKATITPAALAMAVSTIVSTYSSTETELRNTKESLETVRSELATLQADTTSARRIQNLESNLTAIGNALGATISTTLEGEEVKTVILEKIQESRKKVTDLETRVKNLEEVPKPKDLSQDLANKTKELEDLEKEYNNLSRQKEAAEKRLLEDFEKERQTTSTQLTAAQTDVQALKQRLERVQSLIQTVALDLDLDQETAEKMKKSLTDATSTMFEQLEPLVKEANIRAKQRDSYYNLLTKQLRFEFETFQDSDLQNPNYKYKESLKEFGYDISKAEDRLRLVGKPILRDASGKLDLKGGLPKVARSSGPFVLAQERSYQSAKKILSKNGLIDEKTNRVLFNPYIDGQLAAWAESRISDADRKKGVQPDLVRAKEEFQFIMQLVGSELANGMASQASTFFGTGGFDLNKVKDGWDPNQLKVGGTGGGMTEEEFWKAQLAGLAHTLIQPDVIQKFTGDSKEVFRDMKRMTAFILEKHMDGGIKDIKGSNEAFAFGATLYGKIDKAFNSLTSKNGVVGGKDVPFQLKLQTVMQNGLKIVPGNPGSFDFSAFTGVDNGGLNVSALNSSWNTSGLGK